MSRIRVVAGLARSMLVGSGAAAFGAGYAIYEQGAKAMAEAGAFTARADDPSALFFNPAGILELDGIRICGGTTSVLLDGARFESAATGADFKQVNMITWPSSLYYTQKLGKGTAWGFAVTSPFGLKTQWGPAFEGRFISRESNLAVSNINANLAFRLGSKWTGALGLDYAKAEIRELSRNLDLSPLGCAGCEGFSSLTGDGTDVGWNAALRFAAPSGWRWGASYRSGFGYHFTHGQEWRVGLYWDQTPVPDQHVRPRLPDADRKSAQVGYGWQSRQGFVMDVAYQAIFFDDRRTEGSPTSSSDPVQPGLYSNFTSLLGVSLGWNF